MYISYAVQRIKNARNTNINTANTFTHSNARVHMYKTAHFEGQAKEKKGLRPTT